MTEIKVKNKKVCCHGDEDGEYSGHPGIYLDMGEEEKIVCPYCETAFVYDCTVEKVCTEIEEGPIE